MKYLRPFYPTEHVRSYAEITPDWLRLRGIHGVIFDIDNTLVPQDAPADGKIAAYFAALHGAGIKTFILSNNNNENRVSDFAAATGSSYLCRAKKPSGRGYIRAIRTMRTRRHSTLVVGDQLLTDIRGANRLRLKSVLVAPVLPSSDCFGVRCKRVLEKIIFHYWEQEKA